MEPALEHLSGVAVAFCCGDYRLGHAVEAKDNVATRELLDVAPFLPTEPQRGRQQKGKIFPLHSELTSALNLHLLSESAWKLLCYGGLRPRLISVSTRPAPPHPYLLSTRRHADIFIFHETLMKHQFRGFSNCHST